jgi:ribosomal protein S27AE
MIRFSCHCGCDLEAGESLAGSEIPCPRCGEWVEVPHPGADQPDRSIRRCPECDSAGVRCITARRHLKRKLPQGDPLAGDSTEWNQAFIFRLPRECPNCGAIWIPPIPR